VYKKLKTGFDECKARILTSVAQLLANHILDSFKFTYRYQISAMKEKVADTDMLMCIKSSAL